MWIFEGLVVDDERENTEEWKIIIKKLKLETYSSVLETAAKDSTKFIRHMENVSDLTGISKQVKNYYKLCASEIHSAELAEWNFMDSFCRHPPYLKGPAPY